MNNKHLGLFFVFLENIGYMKFIYILIIFGLLSSCSSLESESSIIKKIDRIRSGLPIEKVKSIKLGQLLISIPLKKEAEMPVLFIFGGMYYANPEFMQKNTPQELFEEAVIVFAPCRVEGGKGYLVYKTQLVKQLKKQGIIIRDIAVCGFSAGGPDALEAEGADIKLIGLIDAVPEVNKKRLHYPKIINVFNKQNWWDNEFYGEKENYKHFAEFAKWTKKEGGIVEENEVKHELFPKYFLWRYRHLLI